MALPKGNQRPDLKPSPLLKPLQYPASPQHAHLGPMALPTGNQYPDPKPLPILKPLQKTPEQKNTMRRRRVDPCPVLARRRCRTEPSSSYSERRSSSPLAPPPAKQVPGGFSMLTATCMQP